MWTFKMQCTSLKCSLIENSKDSYMLAPQLESNWLTHSARASHFRMSNSIKWWRKKPKAVVC